MPRRSFKDMRRARIEREMVEGGWTQDMRDDYMTGYHAQSSGGAQYAVLLEWDEDHWSFSRVRPDGQVIAEGHLSLDPTYLPYSTERILG